MTAIPPVPPLNAFALNIYSENGEDGIIREILRRLAIADGSDRWCVEFGAWDGRYRSNTFALVEKGWNAVYIEGDAQKFGDLLVTAQSQPRIVPIHLFVGRTSQDANSLDRLLERTQIPKDFDLLSIDVDSHDLDVWESLEGYHPKIVVIEINSSVPPGIVWRHSTNTPENTFSATQNVALQKKYTLVRHTGNCIYVRNDLVLRRFSFLRELKKKLTRLAVHIFDPFLARLSGLEGIGEVLGLARNLHSAELHDAYDIEGFTVVGQDVLSDP